MGLLVQYAIDTKVKPLQFHSKVNNNSVANNSHSNGNLNSNK